MHLRLFLAGIMAPSLALLGCQSQQSHSIGHSTPAAWLIADAQTEAKLPAALAELRFRLDHGTLDPKTLDAVSREALQNLSDASQPWSEAWANWLEAAFDQRKISRSDWEAYLKLCRDFSIEPREWITRGDPLPMRLTSTAARGHFLGVISEITITVERGPTTTVGVSFDDTPLICPLDVPLTTCAVPDRLLDDGPHTVNVRLVVYYYDTRLRKRLRYYRVTYYFKKTWTLTSSALLPQMVNDSFNAQLIQDCLLIEGVPAPDSQAKSIWGVHVKVVNPPVALVCDIVGRAHGKEWRLGVLFAPTGKTSEATGIFPVAWESVKPVDIILRPNHFVEKQTPYILSAMWDKEIVERLPPGNVGIATIDGGESDAR